MRAHNDAAISLIGAYKKGKVVNFQVSVRIKLDILGRSDIAAPYRGKKPKVVQALPRHCVSGLHPLLQPQIGDRFGQ